MKNFRLHRINFFEPELKSIRCISYDSSISRIAVSRADASIEIWDVTKKPYLEKVIPGLVNSSIETLSWCNGRLFSAGLNGYIIEYDLQTLIQKYQILVSSGSPIWCIAVNKQLSSLASGNEDGHVILHDFTSDGLDFQKKFDKQEGSILCIVWHKYGHVIVTGSIDTIRVWNVETGHVVNRIILGRTEKNTATVVWCISVLNDMTIISGDSCGKTSFWDGNTGTLLSSLAVHKDDVLSLCLNEEESEIYITGVDPIIQMFMQSHSNNKWLKAVQRIVHTHDVRALQLCGEFLVSGGDDCNLVFTKYPPKTTVKYFPFCARTYAAIAQLASCILLRYPSFLELWKIGDISGNDSAKKLLKILTKSNEIITCSAVSDDGKWIAYSSQFQLRLFSIDLGENPSDTPLISKVFLSEELPYSASMLLFTFDSSKLIVYSKGLFYILKCDESKVEYIIEDKESIGQAHLLELDYDDKYFAVGYHNGNVIVYSLESQQVLFRLPHYKYQPTVLKFDPKSENLVVAYSDRKVIEYNLKAEAYTDWSKKHILHNLQEASYHPILSIVFCSDKLFISDENCIYVFDRIERSQPNRKRIKHSENSSTGIGNDNYKTVTKYEHISSVHNIKNELVVVQISPRHIDGVLPPPIWKKKYGT